MKKKEIKFQDIESQKLIDSLNSIGELCGVYKMPIFLSMCALCPLDKKTECDKKYINSFGLKYPLRLIECLYHKIKKRELIADKDASETYFIFYCVITFFYKYKEIPGLFMEYPLLLTMSKTGNIDYKNMYAHYRKVIIEYLVKNK